MNLVNINNISKIKNKERKYLPLEIRTQMYNDVIELRKQGLSYTQIQREIYKRYNEQISMQLIFDWIHKRHYPLESVNKFDDNPSPELAYIIGVMLSDGNKHLRGGKDYRLRLTVKDYEFAEEFGRCLAKVLKKSKPYKPHRSRNLYWVVVSSILLFNFLNKSFEELKHHIKYSKNTVSAFLRALFEGDGTIWKRKLMLFNTNKKLLNYTKYLLEKYFNIVTTGPHLNKKGNKSAKNCYYIYIPVNSLLNFYKYIGFTIKRKQKRLINAIKQ